MHKALFVAVALALAASADTVYTWTGNAGPVNGYYYWNTPGNWENNAVPQSGDDVILDFGTTPDADRNYWNDIEGLRIRGFRINCGGSSKVQAMYGNAITLVGSGLARNATPGGSSSSSKADTYKNGNSNFDPYMPITIEGDYFWFSTGNRSRTRSNFTGDATASFTTFGATVNLHGDWSAYLGTRTVESRLDVYPSSTPVTAPIVLAARTSGYLLLDGAGTYASPILLDGWTGSGDSKITADRIAATLTGLFRATSDGTLRSIRVLTANTSTASLTCANEVACTNITFRTVPQVAGSYVAVTGDKPFSAYAFRAEGVGETRLGRHLDLSSKNVYAIGDGKLVFMADDVMDSSQMLFFGASGTPRGTVDLNGTEQSILDVRRGDSNTGAASDCVITSSNGGILWITSDFTFDKNKVSGTASLGVRNGKTLVISGGVSHDTAGSFRAKENATLKFAAEADISPIASLVLTDGGKVYVPSGTTVTFSTVIVDGSTLPAGVHNASDLGARIEGGGAVHSLMSGPSTEGATAVWQGGTDGNSTAAAANWVGGAPDLAGSSTRIKFRAADGTDVANAAGTVRAYGITVDAGSAFTFGTGTQDAALDLREGGITFDTATDFTFDLPVVLGWSPQTWQTMSGAKLTFAKPVSGLAFPGGEVQVKGAGAVALTAPNPDLDLPLFATNGTSFRIAASEALGSASREVYLWGLVDAGTSDIRYNYFDGTVTNSAPINFSLANGYLTTRYSHPVLKGMFKCAPKSGRTTSFKVYDDSSVTFEGGLDYKGVYRLVITASNNGKVIVRDKPIMGYNGSVSNAELDFQTESAGTGAEFHICVTGNVWKTFRLMKGVLVCNVTNALARDGWVAMGRQDWVMAGANADLLKLDLNGYDQLTCGVVSDWTEAAGGKTTDPNRYGIVTSATPATITFNPTVNFQTTSRIGALRFTGAAALHFNPTASSYNTYRLRNQLSTTTGPLTISAGTLKFSDGAGWGGSSNVIVNGTGTIKAETTAVDTLFGANGAYTCLSLEDSGKIDIPSGCEVKVRWLRVDGRYLPRGKYGPAGSGEGVNTAYASHFAGGGVLNVRSAYPSNGTSLYLR